MQSERREFPNKFGEYNGEQLVKSDGKLEDKFASKLKQNIDLLLRKLYSGLEDEDDSNYSVYTGFSGIALLHYHMYNKLDGGTNKGYLEQAISYIKKPLRHLKVCNFHQNFSDPKYLEAAKKCADVIWERGLLRKEWCCDYGKHGCRIPDTPYSLFEDNVKLPRFIAD
ncbi:hypothetical protein KUTeg_008649 [Tegillarca granosa]|uniref:Uncharacterized protein n=1 Tax=Tegillarca granosa TaxID=220873 RepID=A0ABQ9F9Q0_TEGGR|nr:hypothetical protein KUTeg_008649 [Tegillarca granosa]